MLTISPSIDNISTLTPTADYTVSIMTVTLNVESAKNISASKTIGGGASVAVWENNIAGERRSIYRVVDNAVYTKLKRIKDSGVDEWLVRSGGKIFTAIVDMPAALQDTLPGHWRVELKLVFTGEA